MTEALSPWRRRKLAEAEGGRVDHNELLFRLADERRRAADAERRANAAEALVAECGLARDELTPAQQSAIASVLARLRRTGQTSCEKVVGRMSLPELDALADLELASQPPLWAYLDILDNEPA